MSANPFSKVNSERVAIRRLSRAVRDLQRRPAAQAVGIVTDGITTVDPATEIDFIGATVADGGGGIAQVTIDAPVTGHELLYSSSPVTIADGGVDKLQWDKASGDTLLDLTDPYQPVFVASGIYAISLYVQPSSNMTIGGQHSPLLFINGVATLAADSPAATSAIRKPFVALSLTHVVSAGVLMYLSMTNRDGASSLPFVIYDAAVQKIS